MHAEILLFDGFDELDAMGPWEVLSSLAAARDDVTAHFVTLEGARAVRADHGAVIGAHGRALRAARPRARARRRLVRPDAGTARGLRLSAARSPRRSRRGTPPDRPSRRCAPARCCSPRPGSSTAAAPRRTRGALDDLRARGTIEVVAARVVDDGDILTAGAPACGIDLALHIAQRIGGPGLAEAAARELQYEWTSDRPGLQPVGERA